MNKFEAYFVLPSRNNFKFNRMYSKTDKQPGIKCDQVGTFSVPKSHSRYPERLRRIKYYDSETEVEFVFFDKQFKITATEIALL